MDDDDEDYDDEEYTTEEDTEGKNQSADLSYIEEEEYVPYGRGRRVDSESSDDYDDDGYGGDEQRGCGSFRP